MSRPRIIHCKSASNRPKNLQPIYNHVCHPWELVKMIENINSNASFVQYIALDIVSTACRIRLRAFRHHSTTHVKRTCIADLSETNQEQQGQMPRVREAYHVMKLPPSEACAVPDALATRCAAAWDRQARPGKFLGEVGQSNSLKQLQFNKYKPVAVQKGEIGCPSACAQLIVLTSLVRPQLNFGLDPPNPAGTRGDRVAFM